MKLFNKMTALALALLLLAGSAWAATPETVIPGGNTIGLELKLEGVAIVEFSDPAPEKAGLRRGDLVQKIDGAPVSSVADIVSRVERSAGRVLRLTVRRDGKEKTFQIAARQDGGVWRLGILVRDGITGIGTVTYYNPSDGTFGALGHGVNNGTSGELLPMRAGTVLASQVASVTRGEKGAAALPSARGLLRARAVRREPGDSRRPRSAARKPNGDTQPGRRLSVEQNRHGTDLRRPADGAFE